MQKKIKPARSRALRASKRSFSIEPLEKRELFAGVWSPLVNSVVGAETMMLLTDGSVMVHTGGGISNTWSKLTPSQSGSYIDGRVTTLSPMRESRLYFPSTVLPSGKVHVIGGEYAGGFGFPNYDNTAEIYDPVTNRWSAAASFPEPAFGDTPTSLLRDGRILAGSPFNDNTYLYDPDTNLWEFAAKKLRNDNSVEETWVALPNGNVLSYDVWTDGLSAQYYDVPTNQWLSTGALPVSLVNNGEIGGALQLPDGRILQVGGTNHTAIYDPLSNTWVAGPDMPVGIGSDDAPAVALPNGNILFVADTPNFTAPSRIYEFDPSANTLVDITPANMLNTIPAFRTRFLVVPNGHVLMSFTSTIMDYAPDGVADELLKPTIGELSQLVPNTYRLTGTRLNGYTEGASYGDDAEMASNYPIVQLTNPQGRVYYARTFNWRPGLTTDDTQVTTDFSLPVGLPLDDYELRVIANGISSDAANFSTLPGLSVFQISPGNDSTLQAAPTAYEVRFHSGIDQATLLAKDFTVNGIAASSVTYEPLTSTATFDFASSPVTQQGLQTYALRNSTLRGIDGSVLRDYQGQFRVDEEILVATSMSLQAGASTEPGSTIELLMNFSEPIDPASIQPDSLTLSHGVVLEAEAQPGNQAARFIVQMENIEAGFFMSLNASNIRDQFGNPARKGLAADYVLDRGLRSVLPAVKPTQLLGSKSYEANVLGEIRNSQDVDGFVVKLEKGQVLSAHVHTDIRSGLQLGIRAVDPTGKVLSTSLAELDGDDIFLSAVRAEQAGEYRLEVFSINNTRGKFELVPLINSDIETEFYILGTPNSFPSQAQDLNSAFVSYETDQVLGSAAAIRGQDFDKSRMFMNFYSFDEGNDGFTINNRSEYQDRGLWHRSTRRAEEPGHSPNFSFYYGSDTTGTFETQGANSGSITSSPFLVHPHGPITLNFNYVLLTEDAADLDEASVSISDDGGISFTTVATSAAIGQLPQSSEWREFSLDISQYQGKTIQLRFTFDTKDGLFNNFEGWLVDDVYVASDADWSDYYSFDVAAGQIIRAVATTTSGDLVRVDLEDSQGLVLQAGSTFGTNPDSIVDGYLAPNSGTYYVRVSAELAATYELMVSRDALLEREINNAPATATQITPGQSTLGYVATEFSEKLAFNNGNDGLIVNNQLVGSGASAGLWHLTNRRGAEAGHSGPISFYYGNDTAGNYNTGARNAGSLTTGDFLVPNETPQLLFNYVLRTQGTTTLDRATVEISSDRWATSQLLLLGGVGMPFSSTWRTAAADLSRFAGQTVQFRFTFDTINALQNAFEGWYVDDIEVTNGQRPDWFSVTLASDQSALYLSTRTPGTQSEFQNELKAKIELYDQTGFVLLAEGTPTDEQNSSIKMLGLTPGNTYFVKVSGLDGTRGEYILDALAYPELDVSAVVDDTPRKSRTQDGTFEVSREPDKGWKHVANGSGFQGDYTIHDHYANSGGGNFAEWTIVTPSASFELFTTWVAFDSNATKATYEIYDDSELIGKFKVDQTKSPRDSLVENTTVESMGVFHIEQWRPGRRVSIRLITHGANGDVVADAVFVRPSQVSSTNAGKYQANPADSLVKPLAIQGLAATSNLRSDLKLQNSLPVAIESDASKFLPSKNPMSILGKSRSQKSSMPFDDVKYKRTSGLQTGEGIDEDLLNLLAESQFD